MAALARNMPAAFSAACQRLADCHGAVIVSGVGKAGLIGRKISATLSSTGTRSFNLDPLNAFHGDLGMIASGDVALLLSNRGASGEILLIAEYCREQAIAIIALTQSDSTPLARLADITLAYGEFEEACPLHLAPSTSTTLMLALGDALALAVQREKGFSESDFSRFHPAGSLGRQMKKVEALMRAGDQVACVKASAPVFEAMTALSKARCGLCLVIDDEEHLLGVYSDGDFRRDGIGQLDLHVAVGERCIKPGKRIEAGRIVGEALNLMRQARINALPVVDQDGKALGLLDIQDLA